VSNSKKEGGEIMKYTKPEVVNVAPALAVVQTSFGKNQHNWPDAMGSEYEPQTSAAYEADE
jgi:hypothetical protein